MGRAILSVVLLMLSGCGQTPSTPDQPRGTARATAVFAGGCFWCMEPPYENEAGVISVVSGYTGGASSNPTYEDVSSGATGHYEAVEVTYDPALISYARLLDIFWRNVDPLDDSGQFCDKGPQYRAAIFVGDGEQRRLAEQSKRATEAKLGRRVTTEILPAVTFHRAEEYHQDYSAKNPVRYRFYRFNCGRDERLDALWGDR